MILDGFKLKGIDDYKEIQAGVIQQQMFMEDKVLHHFFELGKN